MFRPLRVINRIPTNLFTRSRIFPSFPHQITYHTPIHQKFYIQQVHYTTDPKIPGSNEEKTPEKTEKTEIQRMIALMDEWVKENTKKTPFFQVVLSYIIKPIISVVIFILALQYVLKSWDGNEIAKTLQSINFTAKKDTGVSFDDVKGIDSVKAELELIVKFLKNPEEFEEIGAEIPKGFYSIFFYSIQFFFYSIQFFFIFWVFIYFSTFFSVFIF